MTCHFPPIITYQVTFFLYCATRLSLGCVPLAIVNQLRHPATRDVFMKIGQSYIRSVAVIGLADFIDSRGGDSEALFSACGLTARGVTHKETFIPFRKMCQLLELSAKQLNMPQFGIEWALSMPSHFPSVGPAMLLAQLSRDLEDWIRSCIRYYKYQIGRAHV